MRLGKIWAISVGDYLILWDLEDDSGDPAIRYLGPDTLASRPIDDEDD
jgi:hypothetical protein